MAQSKRRIEKDLKDLKSSKLKNIEAGPIDEKDLFNWRATIIGPDGSPYEGGIFHLKIKFPKDFPFKPPELRFITKIYHYNISLNGCFCMEELFEGWSPDITVRILLNSIDSLLSKPNFSIPGYNGDAHQLFLQNKKEEYLEKARDWSIKYANAPDKNQPIYYSLKGKERIDYELNNIKYDKNIELTKVNNAYYFCQLKAIIKMPKDTPCEDEKYELIFNIPEDYPLKPPNFFISGSNDYLTSGKNFCQNILKEKWNRQLFIKDIITLLIKSLNYNFLNNIIKEDEIKSKIKILEDSLTKEKE